MPTEEYKSAGSKSQLKSADFFDFFPHMDYIIIWGFVREDVSGLNTQLNRIKSSNDRNRINRGLLIGAGIAVNVLLSYIMDRLGLPLFFDTVGTIAVAALGGFFPGIFTAVVTNVICTLFNNNAIYFSAINALIALYTTWFVKRYPLKKVGSVISFILSIAFLAALLSTVLELLVFRGAYHPVLDQMSHSLSLTTRLPHYLAFFTSNFLLNLLDKGLSTALTLAFVRLIPENVRLGIERGSWKQRPLSDSEIKAMKEWGRDIKSSVRKKTALTLVFTSLMIIIAMSWISVRLYFDNVKEEKTKNAENAANFVASIIDPDRIDDYIREGRAAEGYQETEDMMYKIRNNASGVEYLYVLRIEEGGCRFIFDLSSWDVDANEPGTLVPFEDAFKPYLPDLFAGRSIEPIESNDVSGWVLTVYSPVRDERGNCLAYVGADVSLVYMADYMSEFILKVLLIALGFFMLIISYAIWSTGIYTAYPISSIASCVDRFATTGDDQEKLDADVRMFRALDIRTGDEVEKMYHAICRMTIDQADRIRDLRRLSDSTAKMQDGLIVTMADMVESRDSDTGAHVQKTSAYVRIIAEGLREKGYYAGKITDKFISDVVRSAPLHDVGKISISDKILNKPGKLTDEEYEIMKTHTTEGKKIMENAISTVKGENYLKEARNMAAYHHERWDGKGYPEGLHGEVIPLSARIMAVADVFDALASPRVYKPAFPLEKALAILDEGAGTQFDPKCVEVFMDSLSEVKVILKKYDQPH